MVKALNILVLAAILSSCVTVSVEQPQSISYVSQQSSRDMFSHTIRVRAGVGAVPGAFSTGSGTVVQERKVDGGWEYVVLTAAHVVNVPGGRTSLIIQSDSRASNGWVKRIVSKDIAKSYILKVSDMYDVAVLKFLINEKLPVTPARIARSTEVQNTTPGSQIYGAGCSFGHSCLIYVGILSGRIQDSKAPIASWHVSSINWDGGSSGGGVYNPDIGLIGVISAEQGSSVGLYVPLTTPFYDEDGADTLYNVLNTLMSVKL